MASRPTEDPVVRASRREAFFAAVLLVAAMAYTVGYTALHGYNRSPESLRFVLWFPDWVFWGIVVPWLACIAAGVVYAYGLMGAEELGPDLAESQPALPDEPPPAGHDKGRQHG